MMDNSTRAAWLAERRTGIGGSDAAAILGLNPWTSPYTVWADKLGQLPERPDNEAMRQGRDLEPYVAERFCEVSGKRVRRVNKMLRHSVHTFMLANIDRDIVGESAGLECKTTSCLNIRNFKDGDFPATYYAQAVHYIAVTGAVRWYVAVLILNQGFHVYRLTRVKDDPLPDWCVSSVHVDDAEIDALIAAERDFWRMVEAKTPPPADGSASTAETLQALYADTDGSTAELFGRESTIREYLALRDAAKETDRRMEKLKQLLQQDLKHSERGTCGGFTVTWRAQTRRTFDHKRFFADNPDLRNDAAGYWSDSTYRKFEIREEH